MMMIDQALADRVDGGNGLLPEVAKKNGRIVPAMRFVRSRLEPLLRHARACPEHLQPIFYTRCGWILGTSTRMTSRVG